MTVQIILTLILLLLGAALFCAVTFLYRYAMVRTPFPWSRPERNVWRTPPRPRTLAGKPFNPNGWGERINEADRYMFNRYKSVGKKYEILSHDKLKLVGHYIPADETRVIFLMVHGYRSSGMWDFSCAVQDFIPRGISCFIIDQRAHQESEGDTITFGVREKIDVRDWAHFIAAEFPGVPIILDGMSMGATTVMSAAALDLPPSVRGIIADCGFTSMKVIFERVLTLTMKLPRFPLYPLAELYCRIKNGFGFTAIDAPASLARARVPVLIAHGTADSYVPYSMGLEIYDFVRSKIDVTFFSSPGAEHGESYIHDYERYCAALDAFLVKCVYRAQ